MEYDREFFENSRKVGENGKGDAQPLCRFAFIWFRGQGSRFRVQGSRFKVQGSGGGFAAFLEEGILDTKPSPRGEGGEQSEPDRVLAV